MDLLRVKHPDFEIIVECSNFYGVWNKAKGNIGESALKSTYSWPDGVESVTWCPESDNEEEIFNGEPSKAVFFDNVDYPVWIEFDNDVKSASFGSDLQSENDKFTFRRHILAGCLNYGNEIGKSELNFSYRKGSENKHFSFGFEVLSSKLNYHDHWKSIVEDVEREYRMLSIDYLKRTFHGFSTSQDGENSDLIWWSVFAGEQEKFVKACKSIIERPQHRLRSYDVNLRADKLKRIPALVENELAEHRREPNHLYRVQEQQLSHDTQENRFLKYAVAQIAMKYERLKKSIENFKNVSVELKQKMDSSLTDLRRLQHHSFFRTVGQFKGLTQESQVLQKATNYSQVFRTWHMLRRAYSLNDGMYRLQTKDIATLYEIWCFIEVAHIVKEQLGEIDEVEQSRPEMSGLFTWGLSKDGNSCILFKKDGVELAEVVYNPTHNNKDKDDIALEGLVSPTVPQKPDIVLQLTKNDLQKNMKMTYLFDAKYRIDGKVKGVDVPPEDAINQMHRYRDAIYYKDRSADRVTAEDYELKKEIIGGYILFPGDGSPLDVQASKFQQTIKKVNIGAFPLRPKDKDNRVLLENFVKELIDAKATDTVKAVISQKGTTIEVPNRVLVGYVKQSSSQYYLNFENSCASLYYTGSKFPTTIALHNLHYFMPYIKGKGVRDVYEVVKIRTITAKEAKPDDDSAKENDLRLAFELKFSRCLFDDYVMTSLDIMETFKDTTFDELITKGEQ